MSLPHQDQMHNVNVASGSAGFFSAATGFRVGHTPHTQKLMTSRYWVFTLNNYTDDDEKRLLDAHPAFLRGFQYGRELGSQENTPHLQGVLCTVQPVRLAGLRRRFGNRFHWERCRSVGASLRYTAKDGDVVSIGEIGNSKQGTRTDIQEAVDCLVLHRDLNRVKREFPTVYVKYPRGLSSLLTVEARTAKPKVVWIYGPTGVGKTRYVVKHFGDNLWISSGSLQWFDGYFGQETALLDDFRGSDCSLHFLLRVLDRYPLRVPVKGGFVQWAPCRIFITSAFGPAQTYSGVEDIRQLLRRIDLLLYKEAKSFRNESFLVGDNVHSTESLPSSNPEFERLILGDIFHPRTGSEPNDVLSNSERIHDGLGTPPGSPGTFSVVTDFSQKGNSQNQENSENINPNILN